MSALRTVQYVIPFSHVPWFKVANVQNVMAVRNSTFAAYVKTKYRAYFSISIFISAVNISC